MTPIKRIPGLSELQKASYGDPAIKIAILDGPADLKHPCFNTSGGNLIPWGPPPQIEPSASPGLAITHGTAVSSLIFGKPGSEVEGVAPGCSGFFVPIFSDKANGDFSSASQLELAKSMLIAMEQGANIINISGGQFSKTGEPEIFLKQAIDKCYEAGILIVAATGNDGCSCLHVPAADHQVLAVGSLDENGEPTSKTNFGAAYKINGILAPGKNLTAARAGGGTFQTGEGTSYATPIVSGVAGLLMSLQVRQGHAPDALVIKSILENTSIPCIGDPATECRRFLRGTLNIPAAMAAIRKEPGILAAGMEIPTSIKISPMEKSTSTNPDNTLNVTEAKVEAVVIPAEMPQEQETAAENPNPESAVQESVPKNEPMEMAVEPASPEAPVNPGEVEIQPSSKPATETPNADPGESNKNISKETTPLNQLNNLKFNKMEKMENNVNEQILAATEMTPSPVATPALSPSGEVDPSDCGCGGGKAEPPATVYALGTIGYDFGSESHRDSFIQSMGGSNPNDPAVILEYFKQNPWDAEELIWTLNIDATPIYTLVPFGAHALSGYERIRNFLEEQLNGNVQRISVPGISKGSTTLLNGHKVANLFPRLRGMYAWTTEALVEAATSGVKGSKRGLAENVGNFLNRIYYKMRNLGVTAEERALNYVATNAFQATSVFAAAVQENLELDTITANKSPICKPGAECYDVVLSFFNPKERLNQARKEYRFTVDVSDVVPVTVGEVRSWSVF